MKDAENDLEVSLGDDLVADVKICRPPNNFFDTALIRALADAYDRLAEGPCRAIVLSSQGKHFCAGADFHGESEADSLPETGAKALYAEGLRLFRSQIPVVAAVHGAAIGGGLGLACSADFRVASPDARFSANFSRLGFHQGFGLSVTLPAIVGQQAALEMLYTGARLTGEQALEIGLCDRLVPGGELAGAARALAGEIAASAPLAIRSIRRTMRAELADRVEAIVDREDSEQVALRKTDDFAEGIAASLQRRPPRFAGR